MKNYIKKLKGFKVKRLRMYAKLWKPKNAYLFLLRKYVNFRNKNLSKNKAIRVLDKDWDYLIVLDACRYDLFKLVVNKDSDYIISGGSVTQEWLRWNFKGSFPNIVYIAGNPHLSSFNLSKTFGRNPFFKVIDVWDFGWDKLLKTVPPNKVTESTLKEINIHPEKRIIIHYNQPHHPFLANKELLQYDDGTWHKVAKSNWRQKKTSIFEAAKSGIIPVKMLWQGYIENLKIVMKDVYQLVVNLSGKVVITSDHGNHLGEYMLFGHQSHLRTKELVKVPWFIIKDEKKPSIKKEKEGIIDKNDIEGLKIKEKISDLFKKELI
ncbi:MAG: hypothetical protein ACFFE5_14270 [Candidatus Thorarchaeota archaeon]